MLQVQVLPGAPICKVQSKIDRTSMVGVAQLVEPRVVIPVVVGSSPIVHPNSLGTNSIRASLSLHECIISHFCHGRRRCDIAGGACSHRGLTIGICETVARPPK